MAAMYQFIKYFIYLTRKKLACAKLICGFVSLSNTAITFSSAQCPYISIVPADLERRYILRRTLMSTTMNCSFRLLYKFPPASGSKYICRQRREQIGNLSSRLVWKSFSHRSVKFAQTWRRCQMQACIHCTSESN